MEIYKIPKRDFYTACWCVCVCARVHFKNKLCGNVREDESERESVLVNRYGSIYYLQNNIGLVSKLSHYHFGHVHVLCCVVSSLVSFSHFSSSTFFMCRYAFPLLHLCHVMLFIVHCSLELQFSSVPFCPINRQICNAAIPY